MRSPSTNRRERIRSWQALPALLVAVLTVTTLVTGAAAVGSSAPTPDTPKFGKSIEPFAPYQGGDRCDVVDKPGAVKLANLIRRTYGADESIGIAYNACYAVSEHNEGRALDWMIDTAKKADRAKARAFLGWLLAPDARGHKAAMARRLGVMYIIFNRRMWRAYSPRGWAPYTGTNPHSDHIHISLSLDGQTGRTSYWTGRPLAGPCSPSTLTSSPPPLPVDPMTFVAVPATRVLSTRTGRGVGGDACRLFAPIPYSATPTRVDAKVTGVGSVPSSGVAAVALQVSMRKPSIDSSVLARAAGADRDVAQVSAPLNGSGSSYLVVPVGADGKVSLRTTAGATDLVVDVVGYFPSLGAGATRSTGEATLTTTRPTSVFSGPVDAKASSKVQVAGVAGLPSDATAAVINLIVPGSPGRGSVFAYPFGGARPPGAVVGYRGNRQAVMQTVVPLSARGALALMNRGRSAKNVAVDVVGAYVPSSDQLGLVARRRPRLLASTSKNVGLADVDAGDTKVISLGRKVSSDTRAVLVQVSVREPSADTALTLWARGRRPSTVDVAALRERTTTATVLVPLSPRRQMRLFAAGADHLSLRITLVGNYR